MFMPFHLMKTYIRNPETETKLFLCPSTSSDTDGCAADTSAHIYARGGFFSELGINGNLGWRTVGEDFFCFYQKKIRMTTWDGELLEMLLREYRTYYLGTCILKPQSFLPSKLHACKFRVTGYYSYNSHY